MAVAHTRLVGCLVALLLLFILFSSRLPSTSIYLSPAPAKFPPIASSLQQQQQQQQQQPRTPVNVAAIVENRALDNLIPIVLHFSSVLGPQWPIYIFTSKEGVAFYNQSAPLQRNLQSGLFQFKVLPEEITFSTHSSVSEFFTQPWFWEQLDPAEHVLMFQGDSIICSNSPHTIEEFLEYDFIGAPIDSERGLGHGFNGGLSLRNRSMILDIVRSSDWKEERKGDHDVANVDYEDQWFWKKMTELPPKADGSPAARLPDFEVAKNFSVETVWAERPWGYHQAHVWQLGKMVDVLKWCPEYRLSTTDTFTEH